MPRTLPQLTEAEAQAILNVLDYSRGSLVAPPEWPVFARARLKVQMLTDQSGTS